MNKCDICGKELPTLGLELAHTREHFNWREYQK